MLKRHYLIAVLTGVLVSTGVGLYVQKSTSFAQGTPTLPSAKIYTDSSAMQGADIYDIYTSKASGKSFFGGSVQMGEVNPVVTTPPVTPPAPPVATGGTLTVNTQGNITQIKSTSDGGTVTVGYTYNSMTGNPTKFPNLHVVKIDSQGVIEWNKQYWVAGNVLNANIEPVSDGYLVAFTISGTKQRIALAHILSDGTLDWAKANADVSTALDTILISFSDIGEGNYLIVGSENGYGFYAVLNQWTTSSVVYRLPVAGGTPMTAQSVKILPNGDVAFLISTGTSWKGFAKKTPLSSDLASKKQIANFNSVSDLITLADGSVVMVGTTTLVGAGGKDILVVKLKPDNTLDWQKTIGGPKDDLANKIYLTDQGNLMIVGSTTSNVPANQYGLVVKLKPDGSQILMAKAVGDSTIDSSIVFASSDTQGNYWLAFNGFVIRMPANGEITGCFPSMDVSMSLLTPNYNIFDITSITTGSSTAFGLHIPIASSSILSENAPNPSFICQDLSQDFALKISNPSLSIKDTIQTSDGGFLTVGDWGSNSTNRAMFVAKWDSSQKLIWSKNINIPGATTHLGFSAGEITDGYIAVGQTNALGAGGTDMLIVKLEKPSGALLGVRTVGGPQNDSAKSVTPLSGGGFVVGGYRGSPPSDFLLIQFANNLNTTWVKSVGGASDDSGMRMRPDNSGYIMAGTTRSLGIAFVPGVEHLFLVKYELDGTVSWATSVGISNPLATYRRLVPYDVMPIPTGYVVTGYAENATGGGNDLFLAKFDVQGGLYWIKTVGGSTIDEGGSIALDSSGNYLIQGRSNTTMLWAKFLDNGVTKGELSWAYGITPSETGSNSLFYGNASLLAQFSQAGEVPNEACMLKSDLKSGFVSAGYQTGDATSLNIGVKRYNPSLNFTDFTLSLPVFTPTAQDKTANATISLIYRENITEPTNTCSISQGSIPSTPTTPLDYKLNVGGQLNSREICLNGDCRTDFDSGLWDKINATDIIYNAGHVGIGSADTLATLNVKATGSADPLLVSQAGSSLLKIDSAGNVGVGNAAPTSRLQVQGALAASRYEKPCPTGFTPILANGEQLGCIQNTDNPVNKTGWEQVQNCYSLGGRLPNIDEWRAAMSMNNASIVNTTDNWERLDDGGVVGKGNLNALP